MARSVKITEAQENKFYAGYWAKNKGRLPTSKEAGVKPSDQMLHADKISNSVLGVICTRCTDAYDDGDADLKRWALDAQESFDKLFKKLPRACRAELYARLGIVKTYCLNVLDGPVGKDPGANDLLLAITQGWCGRDEQGRGDSDIWSLQAAMCLRYVHGVHDPIGAAGL